MKRPAAPLGVRHLRRLAFVVLSITSVLAHAQAAKVTENFTFIQTVLLSISATLITIMIIVAGVEVASRHRKLIDIWPIVAGGSVIAGAIGYAAFFVGK